MTQDDLEAIYDAMAQQLDQLSPEQHTLFLAKLALLNAEHIADATIVKTHIEQAARHLSGD